MNRAAVLVALVAATLIAYRPVWTGGVLWDDEGHLTRVDLRSASGLERIWLEPGATQQYYPMLHSTFWLFHRLWGDDTTGYHLANISLHALSAFLLWTILGRLAVPGATLSAFIFALHPVEVESVAWISELKNVLSGVFYFTAALAYLRFDRTRSRRAYAGALALFFFAVTSKTVTITLPVALLVTLWWQRGRARAREDVLPLVPFLALGLAAGVTTIWVERTFIGAEGSEFDLSLLQRCLLASRIVWFYLWKLAWPAGLSFIYPRWDVSTTSAFGWISLIGLLAVVGLCVILSRRVRGPLVALVYFCATLFPALGFFDAYPFRFSFVADHFQYLAGVGPIAVAAAGATIVARSAVTETLRLAIASIVVVMLGVLTFAQSREYGNAESLYRATLARNPGAWLAHNNLAAALLAGDPSSAQIDEAVLHLDAALRLKPDYVEAHYNLGTVHERRGRLDDAAQEYGRILAIVPGERRATERLRVMRTDRATHLLETGLAAENNGRLEDAVAAYREGCALDPDRAVLHRSLGRALHRLGQRDQAVAAYRRALALDDASAETHNDLGVLLAETGRIQEAFKHFERAVQLDPTDAGARANLERARVALKR